MSESDLSLSSASEENVPASRADISESLIPRHDFSVLRLIFLHPGKNWSGAIIEPCGTPVIRPVGSDHRPGNINRHLPYSIVSGGWQPAQLSCNYFGICPELPGPRSSVHVCSPLPFCSGLNRIILDCIRAHARDSLPTHHATTPFY